MDAPQYPPASAYEAPTIAALRFTMRGTAVKDLMADPAAWAIVTRHVPTIKFIVGVPSVQMLLDNMTVIDFGMFGIAPSAAAIAAADAELAALPVREVAR